MFDYESFSEQLEVNNKDIYSNFLGLLSSCNYEMIMFDIFKHQEFSTYERENTIEEEQDFKLLKMIHDEVETYIDKFDISNVSYAKADASMMKICSSFNKSKLESKDLVSMLEEHRNSNYMHDILQIMLLNSLSVRAFHEGFYLLASNKHTLSSHYFNKLKELVWYETPYQEHTQNIRYKALDLAETIWSYDAENILLRKHVSELIIKIMHNKKLSLTQVDNWLKKSKVVPQAIIERYKNNDYGNTKSVKHQREMLRAEIIYLLSDYDCENL